LLLDVLLIPLVVFWSIGHEEYLVSAVFGVLWTAIADTGESYGTRVWRLAVFGLIGAALTALAFSIGGDSWGWIALVVLVLTFLSVLAITFGFHAAASAQFLVFWFIIALVTSFNEHQSHHVSHTWAQVLAWTAGSALWIAVTVVAWLIRGRKGGRALFPEIPADFSRIPLSTPIYIQAVLRAVVLAGILALVFGLNLDHGYWMAFTFLLVMKPTMDESNLVAAQRTAGVVIGAIAATLLLLIPANEQGQQLLAITHGLQMVGIVFIMHAIATRFWSFAYYTAFVSAAVLILEDLQQPSDFANEGYRVLWTVCGIVIGLVTMIVAGLLVKATAPAPPQPTAQPA
jgi:hypothetical protein